MEQANVLVKIDDISLDVAQTIINIQRYQKHTDCQPANCRPSPICSRPSRRCWLANSQLPFAHASFIRNNISWFCSIVLQDWKRYIDIMFASMIANILALATIIFSMQVYDRVVPSQSIPTLWVLAGGVLIAAIFEFVLRISRVYLSDIIGKRADLRISDQVFGPCAQDKNSERSKSTGTFISQIRELEGVRELVTSTTMGAIADLPILLPVSGYFCADW